VLGFEFFVLQAIDKVFCVEFSLCLSRACLGKMFVFKYKWLKRWVLQAIDKAETAERQAEREAFGRAFAGVGITLPENDSRDPSLRKR
jgi:hypothetical protein